MYASKSVFAFSLVLLVASIASAQQTPAIGYMFPPGGQIGQTQEVILGGYDWTPDMQILVHDPRIQLEILGEPGPVIVPEPPYWFGKKARRGPFMLPRETRAKLTIPADVPEGLVRWQVANANGASAAGTFIVGQAAYEMGLETSSQEIDSLPVRIAGQIKHIEEVDRYRFTASRSGPVTLTSVARAIGGELNAAIEIHDASGELIATAADTAGTDTALTFFAEQGQTYQASVYDVDFRGNRAFVYQLSITEGPRVIAAIPAAGQRGQTQSVELVGIGLATGQPVLESITREISYPADGQIDSFAYHLETPHGTAPPFRLQLSDAPQQLEPAESALEARHLTVPSEVTGVLEEKYGEDAYLIAGSQKDVLTIAVEAAEIGSSLDVAVAVYDTEGKELARSDDRAGSTDALLNYTLPADGEYQLRVSDISGNSGDRAAVYRLTVAPATPAFEIIAPEVLPAAIGGKIRLSLKANLSPGFKAPIALTLEGLPPGITLPETMEFPAGKPAVNLELTVAEDAAATASLVTVHGKAMVGAMEAKDDQPAVPGEEVSGSSGPMLVAVTIPPPFGIDAEGKDDVTKWPRGTTFPAPVLIEREEGFTEPIILEMAAKQGRHRQGISGPELVVEPGIERILYPVFLPEWLETTRTSRMVVNGRAQVKDPQGNVRHCLVRQKTRMGFLPVGGLMQLAADIDEFQLSPGEAFTVNLELSRAQKLREPAQITLETDAEIFTAAPQTTTADQHDLPLAIQVSDQAPPGDYTVKVRAEVLQDGTLPVVSEVTLNVRLVPPANAQVEN